MARKGNESIERQAFDWNQQRARGEADRRKPGNGPFWRERKTKTACEIQSLVSNSEVEIMSGGDTVSWRYCQLEILSAGDTVRWRYCQLEILSAGDTVSWR